MRIVKKVLAFGARRSYQQHSDVTIIYENKHYVGPKIGIFLAILHIYLMTLSITSGRKNFAVNIGELEESRDHSASK